MTLDALLLILSVNADFQALVPDRPSGSWDGHLGANRGHCESEKPIKRFQNTVNGSHSSTNVDFRSGEPSNRGASNSKLIAGRAAEKSRLYGFLIHRMAASPPKVLFVPLVGARRPDA